jgi:hypothetical protein
MTIILGLIYYFAGMALAFVAGWTLASALCVFSVLIRLFVGKHAFALLLLLIVMTLGGCGAIYLILHGCGILGDHTHYKMQYMLIAGAVFPGIFALQFIPEFLRHVKEYFHEQAARAELRVG